MPADVDALTFVMNKGAENVNGKLLERFADTTLSTGYPNTGTTLGYSFPRALRTRYGQLGISDLLGVQLMATNTVGVPYGCSWNSQTGKLHIFLNGTEVTDQTSLSTVTLTLKLTGTR